MKLFNYTFGQISILLLVLMSLWGIFFYHAILEEVIDETDDTLENYRDIIVRNALQDPSVLETKGTLMSFYSFRLIAEEEAINYKERYYNSTVHVENDEEPVRVMKSSFMMADGRHYELTVMISTLEREDMIEAILLFLFTLYSLLLISLIIVTRVVLKKAFRPLDRLLAWLGSVQPGKQAPALVNDTKILEFNRLNEAAVNMSNRSYKAYLEQKQFIENASHELQTPLAIARGKIELLAENESTTEEQMKELDVIYNTLGRAVKLNKSLLLLSRIENKQFADTEDIVLNEIVDHILPDLLEIYKSKQLITTCDDQGKFFFKGNTTLAQMLVTNMLKNALAHNVEGGKLHIFMDRDSFIVKNSGIVSLDKEKIFQRFYYAQTEKKDSTGLGLAIAKSIATSYDFKLYYTWDGMHCFCLNK